MASTAQHIAARSDIDLMQRLIAAAEMAGTVPSPQQWVEANIGRLVSVPVDGAQCIADVHAYAADIRAQAVATLPPAPGANPAAVTDVHLAAAVAAVSAP